MSPGYPAVHIPLASPFFGPAVTSGDLIPPWLLSLDPHLELRMPFTSPPHHKYPPPPPGSSVSGVVAMGEEVFTGVTMK